VKNSVALGFVAAVILLAGCGTTPMGTDHWTYSGTDEALRMPTRVPRGELSVAAWMAKRQIGEAEWWQEREALIERAKDACARETGESKVPGYWMGFGNAFTNCMKARGWSVGRGAL
jgi:hypothetical protein